MTKRTVTARLGIVGLLMIALVLFGNCTLMRRPPSGAPPAADLRGVGSAGPEPVVPPLGGHRVVGQTFTRVTQRLDGFECYDCIFHDVVFDYAGGAYRLQNCKFEGSMVFRFTGAAANTVRMLDIGQDFSASKPPSAASASPAPRMVPIPNPVTGDFISPH